MPYKLKKNDSEYDPFKERKIAHPTTDCETLAHLLKAAIGTGILAMPVAFKHAGLLMGIIFTALTAFICTHCAYVLVKCAHHLYRRQRVPSMTFSEVADAAFTTGPLWCRKYAYASKIFIRISLFLTYFCTCSVYTILMAAISRQLIVYYTQNDYNLRLIMAILIGPLVLLSWIPNLKYLAPISMFANLLVGVRIAITFFYMFRDMPATWHGIQYVAELKQWPEFFSITIFAMEAIGVVLPLVNNMKTPENFLGAYGVLNIGMSGVAMIYTFVGFLGYVCYGGNASGSITLNLPISEIPAQIVMCIVIIAVFCGYGLQIFVCVDIVWNPIKDYFRYFPTFFNYLLRTFLVIAAAALAVAVPHFEPFLGLIGSFCFSFLGLIIPVVLETIVFWDDGFGKWNWILWKNVMVFAFGICALIFGTTSAIRRIIDTFENDSHKLFHFL